MHHSILYWLILSFFLLTPIGIRPLLAQIARDPLPSANPARPTVSTPATLTPVGYLHFENGILGGVTSPEFSTRVAINQVTKLTVAPRLQFILQSEPSIWSRLDRVRETQPGEVFAGAQGVLIPGKEKRPTISMSYIRRLYASPAPELDLGTYHQGATFLLSTEMQGFHLDLNAIFNEQIEGRIRRAQFGQTLSVSHPWKHWTLGGELWHFSQPFTSSNAVGNLWAAAYSVRPNLVIDAGFQHGLTSTSTRWEVFAGFTYVSPYRLWKQH
ncbi:MAG: hypothetical protein LAP61_21675 [Acidobacteriia bacterium]|nr:hypothetical protein [Terriglobia bacterium]